MDALDWLCVFILVNILGNYIQEIQYKRYHDSDNCTSEEEDELKEE